MSEILGSTPPCQALRYVFLTFHQNNAFYYFDMIHCIFISCILFLLIKTEKKGGFKTYVMEIKGNHVYSKLKYESGVHRVQRVPQTEAQGRVHTSTATVAIMPEVEWI